ncbi:MAG: inorganic phosphate transporter, partial [Helicobacter sp.]|nr:inorganic phosphate transporter [Helicobacter sp.]
GAIFGVGFLREYLKKRYKKMELKILDSYKDKDIEKIKEFLEKFKQSSVKRKASILKSIDKKKAKQNTQLPEFKKKELRQLKKAYEEELVKRSAINKIISAWLITVPISAIIGGILYFLFDTLGF